MKISNEELKAAVSYDEDTGIFTRIVTAAVNAKAGSRADTDGVRGYRVVTINSKTVIAHRLAFQYVTGREPNGFIDHINGDRSDNRMSNLRECSAYENAQNAKRRSDNTSGYKGVSWHKGIKRWTARIMVNKKHINIGTYSTAEEAYKAYCIAAEKYHGEFARVI